MAVDDQDLREAVIGHALGDVQAEGDEHVGLDVDRPREVDVVQVQAVGDRRQHQHLVRRPPADLEADRLAEEHVDVDRQVVAVLLGRAGRQDDQLLRGDRVVHLGPGQAIVAILGGRLGHERLPSRFRKEWQAQFVGVLDRLRAVDQQPADAAAQVHGRQQEEQRVPVGRGEGMAGGPGVGRVAVEQLAEDDRHDDAAERAGRVDDAEDGGAEPASQVGAGPPDGGLAPVAEELGRAQEPGGGHAAGLPDRQHQQDAADDLADAPDPAPRTSAGCRSRRSSGR